MDTNPTSSPGPTDGPGARPGFGHGPAGDEVTETEVEAAEVPTAPGAADVPAAGGPAPNGDEAPGDAPPPEPAWAASSTPDPPETPVEDVPETPVVDVPETAPVEVPEPTPVDPPEAPVPVDPPEEPAAAAPSAPEPPAAPDAPVAVVTSAAPEPGSAEQPADPVAEATAAGPDAVEPAAGAGPAADAPAEREAVAPSADAPAEPAATTPEVAAPAAAAAPPGPPVPGGPPPGTRPPPRPGATPGRYSAAPWAPGTAPRQAPPPPPPAAQRPSAAEEAGYQSGEVVTGRVSSVDEGEVVVDLGEGRTGVISKRHFSADGKADPREGLAVGDEVEAAVLVREDRLNRVVLSRTWAAKQRAWQRIDEAIAAKAPISGPVTEVVKGGVVVDIGVRAFLPASQLELRHVDDLHAYVGQTVEALVTEADRSADKVVLSRRSLLRRHEKQRVSELLGDLQPGQVRRGRVATITDFGAFVDLGGLRGLLHLSELSWDRVERTTDVVKVGDEIDVKVLAVKDGTKKISLSLRAVRPDPLREVREGEIVQGVVSRLVDFGAFVRIKDGVEGLVHVSELAEHRIHLPEEVVTPGDEVYVKVLRVDRRRRRLDLSINQAVQF